MAEQKIDLCLTFNRVSPAQFRAAVLQAMDQSPYHRENINLKSSYAGDECWLSSSRSCGFAVSPEKELLSVFSCVAGDGTTLLKFAKERYDDLHLNCYATTFLRKFYEKNGFEVIRREPSWLQGKPDVLYMELKA